MRTKLLWGILLVCLHLTGFSQLPPVYDPASDSTNIAYQNQFNTIFEEVDLSQVPSGVLYEYGYPFIAIEAFTGRLADSIRANSMAFGLAYASLASMVVDSTKVLPDPDNYMDVYDTLSPNATMIPVMGLHQTYYFIDSTVLAG